MIGNMSIFLPQCTVAHNMVVRKNLDGTHTSGQRNLDPDPLDTDQKTRISSRVTKHITDSLFLKQPPWAHRSQVPG